MSNERPRLRLSNNIEHYLSALSKYYAQEGESQKQEIIVNSQVRIHEDWNYDNWDGGRHGHALYLTVPENLYLKVLKKRNNLQDDIRGDINKIHNIHNESIEAVFLEMEAVEDGDWRRESGLFQSGQRTIAPAAVGRIWGDGGYRLFLSHRVEVKKEVAELKKGLKPFGISAFVAHEDIHPTKKWEDEIENALASMDAFVALLTKEFHDSLWTDQEVGYAVGRGVPLIAVKLGKDPYGFIGKFQALSCNWDEAPIAIAKLLIKYPRMLASYVTAVPKCKSFRQGNVLSEVLTEIESITDDQAAQLVSAYNKNAELRGSFGFNGAKANVYGDGLAVQLSRITGKKYVQTPSWKIKLKVL